MCYLGLLSGAYSENQSSPAVVIARTEPRTRERIIRYRHHIFVCVNQRPEGHPKGCCAARGSEKLREFLKLEISKRGLKGRVRANQAGCLDACEFGPSVVVYPEGTWYTVPTEQDAREILDRHIGRGEVVERLLMPAGGAAEIQNRKSKIVNRKSRLASA